MTKKAIMCDGKQEMSTLVLKEIASKKEGMPVGMKADRCDERKDKN